MMWLKKSTNNSRFDERRCFLGVAVPVLVAATLCGCGKPRAAQPAPKPTQAYVQLEALEEAHPLANSLRELDAVAERLNRDNTARAASQPTNVRFAPVSSRETSPSDTRRNLGARQSLRRSAEETLSRYIAGLRSTNQRIRAEKRAELEGIARAQSATKEAQERARIENDTRNKIVERSDEARDARIRRNAARLNLSNNNVISVARDPETNLPSQKRLEEQINELREREKNPLATNDGTFLTSDEARLTKLLRDLEALLANIRAANERDTDLNNKLIDEAIARVRSQSAEWVEDELAKLPIRDQSRTELIAIRRELVTLLQNLQQTELTTRASALQISQSGGESLPPIVLPQTTSPVTSDLFQHLSAERTAMRTTIQRDVLAAVRDAGLVHNVAPVFRSSSNIPNRTDEFRQWIFGNVDAVPLSNQSATH